VDREVLGVALVSAGALLIIISGALALFNHLALSSGTTVTFDHSSEVQYVALPHRITVDIPVNARDATLTVSIFSERPVVLKVIRINNGRLLINRIGEDNIFEVLRVGPGLYEVVVERPANVNANTSNNMFNEHVDINVDVEYKKSKVDFFGIEKIYRVLEALALLGTLLLLSGVAVWAHNKG